MCSGPVLDDELSAFYTWTILVLSACARGRYRDRMTGSLVSTSRSPARKSTRCENVPSVVVLTAAAAGSSRRPKRSVCSTRSAPGVDHRSTRELVRPLMTIRCSSTSNFRDEHAPVSRGASASTVTFARQSLENGRFLTSLAPSTGKNVLPGPFCLPNGLEGPVRLLTDY